jgi:hypothetical protein
MVRLAPGPSSESRQRTNPRAMVRRKRCALGYGIWLTRKVDATDLNELEDERSDIPGFTETTDRLESEDLTWLLKHYLTEMSQTALAYVRCSKCL